MELTKRNIKLNYTSVLQLKRDDLKTDKKDLSFDEISIDDIKQPINIESHRVFNKIDLIILIDGEKVKILTNRYEY